MPVESCGATRTTSFASLMRREKRLTLFRTKKYLKCGIPYFVRSDRTRNLSTDTPEENDPRCDGDIKRFLFTAHRDFDENIALSTQSTREAAHLVAKYEKCLALRAVAAVIAGARILLDTDDRPARASELRNNNTGRCNMLPRNGILRTERRLCDFLLNAPKAVGRPRRETGKIYLRNTRRIGSAEYRSHVMRTPHVVQHHMDFVHPPILPRHS